MDAAIKERWLTRLRDGSRRQGTSRLETIDGDGVSSYCCLGILCELAVEDGVIVRHVPEGVEYALYDGNPHYPTQRVAEWAGLAEQRSVEYGGDIKTNQDKMLATLNDGGASFEEIADAIEAGL